MFFKKYYIALPTVVVALLFWVWWWSAGDASRGQERLVPVVHHQIPLLPGASEHDGAARSATPALSGHRTTDSRMAPQTDDFVNDLSNAVIQAAIQKEVRTRKVIFDKINANGYQTYIVKFDTLSPEEILAHLNTMRQRSDQLPLKPQEKESIFKAATDRVYELANPTFPLRFLMVESKADGSEAVKGTYFQTFYDSPFTELENGGVAIKNSNSSSRYLTESELKNRFAHLVKFD